MEKKPYTVLEIASGSEMETKQRDAHWQLLRRVGNARERLHEDEIIAVLAVGAVYESQGVLNPLVGRAEIEEYLKQRFRFFKEQAAVWPSVKMRPGTVDLPEAKGHPCLIFEFQGQRQALWKLQLSEDMGKVERLDILTVAPRPDHAVQLDDWPK